ncbi:hypothetical protein AB0910_06165 [Streptomyces sp. NPDC047002]|uniref:COG4315 family predicted lipoprotein n=1 Tax=Streptomyces sp. NPDC047002 TaxID=3155475 RepID=UPI00345421F2
MIRALRTPAIAAAGLALAAFATACSSGGGSSDSAASAPATPKAAASGTAAAPSTPADGAGGVGVSDSPALGRVLVDGSGRTLYVFDQDATTPGASSCYQDCAAKWPPVPATTHADGVNTSLLGSITRKDGTHQLTVGSQPVYLFAGDSAAGDTKGQGVKGAWHAVDPQGTKITKAAPAT